MYDLSNGHFESEHDGQTSNLMYVIFRQSHVYSDVLFRIVTGYLFAPDSFFGGFNPTASISWIHVLIGKKTSLKWIRLDQQLIYQLDPSKSFNFSMLVQYGSIPPIWIQ